MVVSRGRRGSEALDGRLSGNKQVADVLGRPRLLPVGQGRHDEPLVDQAGRNRSAATYAAQGFRRRLGGSLGRTYRLSARRRLVAAGYWHRKVSPNTGCASFRLRPDSREMDQEADRVPLGRPFLTRRNESRPHGARPGVCHADKGWTTDRGRAQAGSSISRRAVHARRQRVAAAFRRIGRGRIVDRSRGWSRQGGEADD